MHARLLIVLFVTSPLHNMQSTYHGTLVDQHPRVEVLLQNAPFFSHTQQHLHHSPSKEESLCIANTPKEISNPFCMPDIFTMKPKDSSPDKPHTPLPVPTLEPKEPAAQQSNTTSPIPLSSLKRPSLSQIVLAKKKPTVSIDTLPQPQPLTASFLANKDLNTPESQLIAKAPL